MSHLMADKSFYMKTAFTFLSLLCCVTLVNAQKWHYGLKTDINYAGLTGTGVQSRLTYNFQGGFFAERELDGRWSVQGELLYNQNTYKRTSDFLKYYPNTGKVNSSEKMYLSYMAIPVLVKYKINQMVSLHVGPQYSTRVYSNENLLKENADAFTKNELSVNAGVEASLSFLSLYVRYNCGLSDINNADDRYSWRAQRIQAGIAIRIK